MKQTEGRSMVNRPGQSGQTRTPPKGRCPVLSEIWGDFPLFGHRIGSDICPTCPDLSGMSACSCGNVGGVGRQREPIDRDVGASSGAMSRWVRKASQVAHRAGRLMALGDRSRCAHIGLGCRQLSACQGVVLTAAAFAALEGMRQHG